MRRVIAPVLMIIALLLGGCGESERLEKQLAKAREGWCAAESISVTADVTAELSDSTFKCRLLCTHSPDETVVEVLSPENIAGIRARLKDGETKLEYDGLILAVADPGLGEISPIKALPMLMEALLHGHAALLWTEAGEAGEMIATELYISENQYARLWFDKENCALLHGELVSDGEAVVKCEIVSFTEE